MLLVFLLCLTSQPSLNFIVSSIITATTVLPTPWLPQAYLFSRLEQFLPF